MKRIAILNETKDRVKNISLCDSLESALEFHGDCVVEETEITGEAGTGYYWDGSVFTPGNPNDLVETINQPVEE